MSRRLNSFISILVTLAVVLVFGATASYAASVYNATAYVNTPGDVAIIRAKASTSAAVRAQLDDKTDLTVRSIVFVDKSKTTAKKKWYYVSANGKTGYIRSDLVKGLSYNEIDAKTTKKVVYRKGAGTSMDKVGTIPKGTKIKVILKAKPVNSVKGSSATWYMIQYKSKKYYVCSTNIKLLDTGSNTEPATPTKPDDSGQSGDDSKDEGNRFSKMTNEEFKAYLVEQGFPEAYRTELIKLHKTHSNWIFKAVVTNMEWDDVLAKQTKDGVSLISSSFPTSYRAKDSNSYQGGTVKVYKDCSTAEKVGSVKNGNRFTILDEVWKGTTRWCHIVMSDGTKGYMKGSLTSQKYPNKYAATVTDDDVNLRKGAGTDNSVVDSADKGDEIKVILKAVDKNGNTWYKIKLDSGYAYIISDYVQFQSDDAVDKLDNSTASATVPKGKYIPKDGSSWFNAKKSVVAYYLDPRNFLNADRIYMFENLSYDEDAHTAKVVDKVLNDTLKNYGFTAEVFVTAGKKYNISPVFLASRAKQETGGGSSCINGSKYNGKVVYNPFNIGAYSSDNPQQLALKRAYDEGWFTQQDAVNGSAKILAESYINSKYKQNTIYFQRFNTATGELSYAGTHQYMTNITAPYTESSMVRDSYEAYGIDEDELSFLIPVYKNMPDSTSLPE